MNNKIRLKPPSYFGPNSLLVLKVIKLMTAVIIEKHGTFHQMHIK